MKLNLLSLVCATACTLLPTGCMSTENLDFTTLLKPLDGVIQPQFRTYDNAKLKNTQSFVDGKLVAGTSEWSCKINQTPVEDDAIDLNINFKLEAGEAKSSGVAVSFDFTDWNTENYVLLPASVYNGNRCKIVNRGYAKGLERKYLYKKGLPLMSVPIPQLSPEAGKPSRIDVSTTNLSTPAMCFYNHKTKRAFILLAEQGIRHNGKMINNGFIVEESADRKSATFTLSAPGVRARKPLFVGFTKSPDRGINFKAGDTVNMKLRLYSFDATGIPALLEKFMTVRKAVTGQNSPRELMPFSHITKLMTKRIDSRFTGYGKNRFYAPENASWISFGWVGGLINTFPMLVLGDDMHLDRAVKTFDFAIPAGQGESGYFYGALNHDGKPFGRETYNELPEIALSRKSADVLFWMIKQFKLLKAQGKEGAIKPAWESNIKRLADAFVKTWKAEGTWGRMVNNKTGRVAEVNTCGGVMAIGGLALASEYYSNPEYLKIAKEAAHFNYQNDFVKTGQTTGGIADTLQNADSESAAGFMTALMTLYEITGEKQWLDKSRNLANLVATWTTSFDYLLPPNTELARAGAKLTGVYWASTQNKHGAPGICTSSGDPLFKIYRATGDRRYAELMRDIVRCHAESIRPDGRTNERLTYCDADGHSVGNRGNHVTGWNETNGILMAMELPGIYLRTDKDEKVVFDHVKANVINRDTSGVTLEITNPTKFVAEVAVFAENAEQARKIQGDTAFLNWPKVNVPAGKTVEVRVSTYGKIIQ